MEETQIKDRAPVTNPHALNLFQNPPGTLRLTVADEYSYPIVRIYQAAPLSKPRQYLVFQDGKGEEIVQVGHLNELAPEAQIIAEEELQRRYLTARIEAIANVKTEFGATYWNVLTNKGERDFVVQSLSESCVWLSESHILLIDVDGNRFEIPDRAALDKQSEAHLASVL